MDAIGRINEINGLLSPDRLRLPFPMNTIQRVSHWAYPQYGITLTPENREEVRRMSSAAFLDEWKNSDWRMHTLISDAINMTPFRDAMSEMNREIGFVVSELMKSRSMRGGSTRGAIRICDIGTGTGNTVLSIIRQFRDFWPRKLLGRCHFTLMDLAEEQLESTGRWLKEKFGVGVETSPGPAEDVMPAYVRCFDFIVSNGAFHHMSLPDMHGHLYNALKDNGAVVIGDYHTTVWDYPARMARFLENMGADKRAVRSFRHYFCVRRNDHLELDGLLNEQEQAAVCQTVAYGFALTELIRKRNIRDVVINPVEAQRSSRNMALEMASAGFSCSMADIRAAFPASYVDRSHRSSLRNNGRLQNSDVARVTTGVKDQRLLRAP